jgi:hypothetical protein
MKLTSDQISDIPYVLFINDKGQGWTLNRQYKLQYHNIGGWKGLRRDVIEKLIPLALRSESKENGYCLTDPEAIPSWARKAYRVRPENASSFTNRAGELEYCIRTGLPRSRWDRSGNFWQTEFTAYWFDQWDEKTQQAFYNPQFDEGVTFHFKKAAHVAEEIKDRKAEVRADITKHYREEFRIRKPWFCGGDYRVYVTSDSSREAEQCCERWNDWYWNSERFTIKDLKDAIEHFRSRAEPVEGTYHFDIEGEYRAASSFEEAENCEYELWEERWQVDKLATLVVK